MVPSPSPQFSDAISGRYAIGQKLGTGSVGTVYLAHDTVRGEAVALKLIRPERASPETVARLKREFRAIAVLDHPNIAAAYDFGYADDPAPLLHATVRSRWSTAGRSARRCRSERYALVSFLRPSFRYSKHCVYLHEHNVLHLDVHAGNVIVTSDGRAILIDFGLLHSCRSLSGSGVSVPLLALPPELLQGYTVSPATDVYLAGRLLQYRLTGNQDGEFRLPREIPGWGPRLTLDLERLVVKATQADPRQRFVTIAELRRALLRSLGESAAASPPARPVSITVGRDRELEKVEEVMRRPRQRGRASCFVSPARRASVSHTFSRKRVCARSFVASKSFRVKSPPTRAEGQRSCAHCAECRP